ncbi:unnamed protein product [Diamesa tonsa]
MGSVSSNPVNFQPQAQPAAAPVQPITNNRIDSQNEIDSNFSNNNRNPNNFNLPNNNNWFGNVETFSGNRRWRSVA